MEETVAKGRGSNENSSLKKSDINVQVIVQHGLR